MSIDLFHTPTIKVEELAVREVLGGKVGSPDFLKKKI